MLRKEAVEKGTMDLVDKLMADDKLALAEGELLRAICAALDSPLPPILESTEAVA